MTATKDSIDKFHKFAREKLDASNTEISWDELLIAWQSACERDATNAAIREAIDDIQAGRYQPADEVMRDLRSEFGIDE